MVVAATTVLAIIIFWVLEFANPELEASVARHRNGCTGAASRDRYGIAGARPLGSAVSDTTL